MVKSLLPCKATVCRSGTSNSTFSPSVLMYQLRERARSVTGILRWSNLIMSRHLQRVTVLARQYDFREVRLTPSAQRGLALLGQSRPVLSADTERGGQPWMR